MAELPKGVTEQLEQYMEAPRTETPQERFDAAYISSAEIMEQVGVSRPSVNSKMLGRFPAIKIGNTYIWERTPAVVNFVQAWAMMKQG